MPVTPRRKSLPEAPAPKYALESIPPPPTTGESDAVLAWLEVAVRGVWRHAEVQWAEIQALLARVTDLEESLGEEGSATKDRPATGLHLALERAGVATARRFDEMNAEIASVLRAVTALSDNFTKDQGARQEALRVEVAKTDAADAVRAPWRSSWSDAKRAFVMGVVALLLTVVHAVVAAHVH